MKVLIAMDSFKGSISSMESSKAISKGIKEIFPNAEIVTLPLADGGEGTIEALVHATGGNLIAKEVIGPLGKKTNASYGISQDGETAFIEIAAACGLPLLKKEERNPLITTTYGVGELIMDALEKGCRDFIIGLGGSATNDAGVGMLQALGFRFLDENGKDVPFGGRGLQAIKNIKAEGAHPLLKNCTFQIACDVRNTLHGNNGAAHIYAPQKGASPEMVQQLDDGLRNFCKVVFRDIGVVVEHVEGAGAAGGLGAAFFAFLNGKLQSGTELILHAMDIEGKMRGVDIVITGEGMLDGQTSMGKAPSGVARIAAKKGITVIALVGGIKQDFLWEEKDFTACFSIVNKPMSLAKAMKAEVTYENLLFTTRQIFSLVKDLKEIE